jgi:exodeoxyribonuclease VII large subunit
MSVPLHTSADPGKAAPFGPQALLHALHNSLTSPLLQSVLLVKGIYRHGKGVAYNNHYYDSLSDVNTDAAVTLAVPALLRNRLKNGQLIEGLACFTKRQQANSGRIELVLHLTEIQVQQERVTDEAELHALAVLRQKAQAGYKDPVLLLQTKLTNRQPIRVTVLIGLGAVIDGDIRHAIGDAATLIHLQFQRINFGNSIEIIKAFQTNPDPDILVIACGGGDHLNIFNQPTISEAALQLKPIFLTALGHATDEPLLQKVADKAFITPTALGQFFTQTYLHCCQAPNVAQLDSSDRHDQLRATYETRLARSKTRSALLLIIAIVLGILLIGLLLRR